MKYALRTKIKKKIKNKQLLERLIYWRNLFRAVKYYVKYYKIRCGLDSVASIHAVAIEFSSVCNLKCRYCFLEKGNKPDFLDLGIYKKLLTEICENKKYNIHIMEWPISGDFFLHPDYREIIKLTQYYKDNYSNFSPWIILTSNMMLLDEEKIEFIFKCNIINQIICSIDGRDKESYEYMRPQASFEKLIKNISYLIRKNKESKNKITIQINNGLDPNCNSKEFDPRLKEIFNQVDYITEWELHDWNESFHSGNPIYVPYKYFCSFVFDFVSLNTAGSVIKCPLDLRGQTEYGDFRSNSLESIWLSDERKNFLKLMYKGRRDLASGCQNCSISYVGQNKFKRR